MIGLNDNLEYVFKREWTGAAGKLNSDTPLVRWHYKRKFNEPVFNIASRKPKRKKCRF